jgi:hypothetical protein
MTDKEKIDKLKAALGALLCDCDYTDGACSPNEMVGAVVNPVTLKVCKEALEVVRS